MFSTVSLVVLAGVLSTGCLQKDVTQTIYISPEAAVWSVIEKDVRSDDRAPAGRIAEEHEYFLAAAVGRHPVAQAFHRLGAQAVTTTWLRRTRPFTVVTEARFASLEQLFKSVLRAAEIGGDVTVVRTVCGTRVTVKADSSSGPSMDAGSAVDALIGDLDDYRIVLTEGRFVSVEGFTILGEGSTVVPDRSKTMEGDTLVLMLEWVGDGCAHSPR
jgi:hypothetical protein